jgi:hypothetical protein
LNRPQRPTNRPGKPDGTTPNPLVYWSFHFLTLRDWPKDQRDAGRMDRSKALTELSLLSF